jgi:hypothetical protein
MMSTPTIWSTRITTRVIPIQRNRGLNLDVESTLTLPGSTGADSTDRSWG